MPTLITLPAVKDRGLPIAYKSCGGSFKSPSATSRVVEGAFASFDTVDSDFDIIRPGAFAKSIAERGPDTTSNRQIKYLHQHRITELCGPLVKLWEDSLHLNFKGEIEKTPLGDVIIERYSNGTYREHSIGFMYVWDKCEWIEVPASMAPRGYEVGDQKTIQVFECTELNLFEGSVVTFGSNPNTPFAGFKGSKEDLIGELNRELAFLIKNAPNYEYELRIRQLWQKQISLAESLAGQTTKEDRKPKAQAKDGDLLSILAR